MTNAMRLGVAAAATLLAAASTVGQQQDLHLADSPGIQPLSFTLPSVPSLATDGSAIVALTIRADGRVEDAVTLVATDRRLAKPARDAVMRWRFERDPELGRGRDAQLDRVLRREVVEFLFKRDKVTAMNHREGAKAWFPQSGHSAVHTVRSADLDTPLVRKPTAGNGGAAHVLSGLRTSGRAVVSYVVDESGAVRLPFVETADTPEIAAAALALVAGWTYEPPTHDGRPVLVEERNVLTFNPR